MTRHRMAQVLLIVGALLSADRLRAQCSAATPRPLTARQYDAARTRLHAQLARVPNDAAAMHCLGRLLLDHGDAGDAVEWLEKAVALHDKHAQYHMWVGLALRADGEHAGLMRAPGIVRRMKTAFEQALTLDPTLVEARYALVQFYAGAPALMGGSMTKAREQAAEMLKLNPMRGRIGNGVIAEREGDYAAAEREFLAATAIRPDSDVAYSAAGAFYRRRERWTDAMAMYETQLKVMSKDALPARVSNAHYFLGMAHAKSSRSDRARAEYQKAIAANPDNQDARKALASLK